MMKYKKLVIILSVVVGVVALGFILSYTLFRLNKVEINFKNEIIMSKEVKAESIIESANFSYSIPIFACNKSQITNRIEKLNPYVKVINIETVFPNRLILHVAQREEFFVIQVDDNLYCICDDELKVLKYHNEDNKDQLEEYFNKKENAILIDGVEVINKNAQKGDCLQLYNNENIIKNLSRAFAYNNKTIADIKGMFKKIAISYETNFYTKNNETVLTLTTFDNFDVKIDLPSHHLV